MLAHRVEAKHPYENDGMCAREKSIARCVRDEHEEERTNPKSSCERIANIFPRKKSSGAHTAALVTIHALHLNKNKTVTVYINIFGVTRQTGISFWSFIPVSRTSSQSLACCKLWTLSYFLWIYQRKKNQNHTKCQDVHCGRFVLNIFISWFGFFWLPK